MLDFIFFALWQFFFKKRKKKIGYGNVTIFFFKCNFEFLIIILCKFLFLFILIKFLFLNSIKQKKLLVRVKIGVKLSKCNISLFYLFYLLFQLFTIYFNYLLQKFFVGTCKWKFFLLLQLFEYFNDLI